MSQITITISTQPFDFGTVNLGTVELQLEYDGLTVDINEQLSEVAGYLRFQVVEWYSPQEASDGQQCSNYVTAFNRDHKNVGGTKNLAASLVGNVITITAKKGIFKNANYTGNAFNSIVFDIDNSVQEEQKTFDYTRTTNGDCSLITYTAQAASGGTAPYRLELNGNDFVSSWDGNTDEDFDLQRNKAYSGNLYDSLGTAIEAVSIIPPRKLKEGDFKVDTIDNIGFSDISIRVVTEVLGTTPLEYAIEDSDSNITPYQTSTVFGGYPPGLYTLHVRDVYGCEVTKVFEVYEFVNPNGESRFRHFSISNFNSLSFSEHTDYNFDNRRNFDTTLSRHEAVGIPYSSGFCFPDTANIRTQFKSSYDIHVCTLHRSDGTKVSLPLIQTQQNIGTAEKVDCKVFPSNGKIGVYFDGGNKYEPSTTTVIDSSDFIGSLPAWAEEGAFVVFGSLGAKEIQNTGLYDSQREVLYFEVDGTVAAEDDETVQATYNRHEYNLYRMDFSAGLIDNGSWVSIEAGWSFDEIERRFDSERLFVLDDPTDFLKITWNSRINFDDMVFSDGIGNDEGCQMWVKGRIRPIPVGDSETKEGDDRVRSLRQRHRMSQKLEVPILSAKQWHKLGLASGIADDGDFIIEGMKLVMTEPLDAEEVGDTNLYNVSATYAMVGESLAVKQDEIVLNPSTGKEGTAQTGKEPITDPQYRYLRTSDGNWLKTSDGRYISLSIA